MKNDPYFARTHPTYGSLSQSGITQYAEIAARFHAAVLASSPEPWPPKNTASTAFDHADAFFAELKRRELIPTP